MENTNHSQRSIEKDLFVKATPQRVFQALTNQDPASYPTASTRPKRCSPRLASSASQGEGHTARTSTTDDASTHPLEERLRTGSFRARDEVAVSGTLTERMGSNELS